MALTRLVSPTIEHGTSILTSSGGKKVYFATDRDGNSEIYEMNADGSGTPRNLTNHPAYDADTVISTDGQIAFVSDRDGKGVTKHICTRFFLSLSLKRFVRFANACHLSMWDYSLGSRADGFRRSPFARSSHHASAEFGFPVLVGVGFFIAHAPDIGAASLPEPLPERARLAIGPHFR
jgi:hypothetical protein